MSVVIEAYRNSLKKKVLQRYAMNFQCIKPGCLCVGSTYSEEQRCMSAGEILQLVGDRLSADVHLSVPPHPRWSLWCRYCCHPGCAGCLYLQQYWSQDLEWIEWSYILTRKSDLLKSKSTWNDTQNLPLNVAYFKRNREFNEKKMKNVHWCILHNYVNFIFIIKCLNVYEFNTSSK